jgi:hypothetical protein
MTMQDYLVTVIKRMDQNSIMTNATITRHETEIQSHDKQLRSHGTRLKTLEAAS